MFLVIFVMDGPGKALTVFLKFLKKKGKSLFGWVRDL